MLTNSKTQFWVATMVLVLLGLARFSFAAIESPIGDISLEQLIANIIKYALTLTAVIAVGYIVYGGFLYISAGGDSKQIEAGKTAVIGAVVGIIIIGLAYAIVEFVINAMGGGGGGAGGGGLNG